MEQARADEEPPVKVKIIYYCVNPNRNNAPWYIVEREDGLRCRIDAGYWGQVGEEFYICPRFLACFTFQPTQPKSLIPVVPKEDTSK